MNKIGTFAGTTLGVIELGTIASVAILSDNVAVRAVAVVTTFVGSSLGASTTSLNDYKQSMANKNDDKNT